MALNGAALQARLGAHPDLAALQLAADASLEALDKVRASAGLGPEVSNAELARASAELLIAQTAAHLEAAGAQSAALRQRFTGTALGHGAQLGGALGLRLGRGRDPDEGPDPVLKGPAPRDLARAMTRLKVLRAGRKLSSEDTKVLLQQTAWATRQALAGVRWQRGLGEKTFTPQNIQGACGYGQACTAFHLEDLGVPASKVHLHQAADAFDSDAGFRHAFVVAQMPDGKPYLIDCTFRQFFQPEHDGEGQVGEPGRIMRATRRGRQVSDELLAHGFVELTDEVASLYGAALAADPKYRTRAEDLLRSTMEIDYDRDEILALPAPPALPEGPTLPRRDGPPMNRGPP